MNKVLIVAMIFTMSIFAGSANAAKEGEWIDGKCKHGSFCVDEEGVIVINHKYNTGENGGLTGGTNIVNIDSGNDAPVSTARAPALTSSNDTCMGSTSVGAQGLLIGLSFGTTWTDNDCITRKDARFIHNTGHRTVALSLMCGKESVRAAVARAGTPEQRAACSITDAEIDSYRAKPIIVSVDRVAPSSDENED